MHRRDTCMFCCLKSTNNAWFLCFNSMYWYTMLCVILLISAHLSVSFLCGHFQDNYTSVQHRCRHTMTGQNDTKTRPMLSASAWIGHHSSLLWYMYRNMLLGMCYILQKQWLKKHSKWHRVWYEFDICVPHSWYDVIFYIWYCVPGGMD